MLMNIAKGESYDPMSLSNAITNASGSMIPMAVSYVIGLVYNIMMIVFMCMDSQTGTNKYGPSPKYMTDQEEILKTDD